MSAYMYDVSPLYNFNSDIKLPTCMYKMSNIHEKCTVTQQNTEESHNALDLVALEKSQLCIIQKLEDLKAKVLQLKEELGIVSTDNFGGFQDIVIKANPQNPPLSVWVFYHLFSASTSVRLVTYKHSSLKDIPLEVQPLQSIPSVGPCKLSLTVIWRHGDADHEMMINPLHQSAIEGEVNIARYLSRLLSFGYDSEDPATSTDVDNWLELSHSSVIHGNTKERQGALRALNVHLGKRPFLVGETYTVADIAMWSALLQTGLHRGLPANALKWFKSLSSIDVFEKCASLYAL